MIHRLQWARSMTQTPAAKSKPFRHDPLPSNGRELLVVNQRSPVPAGGAGRLSRPHFKTEDAILMASGPSAGGRVPALPRRRSAMDLESVAPGKHPVKDYAVE